MFKAFRVGLSAWFLLACVAAFAAESQVLMPEPRPSPPEQKILAALDMSTELEFVDQPLSDVIEYLKERHKIEIQMDQKELTDAGIGSDTPITKNVKGIKLASALDLMLSQLDLDYAIHDEVLLITSKAASQKLVTTKVYPVADLLAGGDSAARPKSGDEYKTLIELIAASVAPTTWDDVGGRGSIQEFRQAGAIIISQTLQVHREIEKLLAGIRAVQRQRPEKQRLEQQQPEELPKQATETAPDDCSFYLKAYRLPPDWRAPGAAQAGKSTGGASQTSKKAPSPISQGCSPPTANHPTAEELAKAIPELIEPESWDVYGGYGSIRAFDFKLLVRQTGPIHRQIEQLLRELN